MGSHAAIFDIHRIAGKFLAVYQQIIASFEFSTGNAHLMQGFNNRFGENGEIARQAVFILDKAKGKIAQIMIDRTTARHSPHDVNPVCFDIGLVHFFHGILIAANNN